MASISSENQPLLRGTSSDQDIQQRYDGVSNHVSVKSIDEEYLINGSDSSDNSTSTVDIHDPDYIVSNRLGDVSLSMIVLW